MGGVILPPDDLSQCRLNPFRFTTRCAHRFTRVLAYVSEHLLCAIRGDHAASLFLGSQLIYFHLFLLLSKSIFLCFESRYVFNCKSHKTLQQLNQQGIYFNHLPGNPGLGRPGLVQLLRDVIATPDSLLLQHLTSVLIVTACCCIARPCTVFTPAEAGQPGDLPFHSEGSPSPRTSSYIVLARTCSGATSTSKRTGEARF